MSEPLTDGVHRADGPTRQRPKTGERRGIDRGSTKLTDGGLSGDGVWTTVNPSTWRTRWAI